MKFAKIIACEYQTTLLRRSHYFREVYDSFGINNKFENYLDLGCGKGYNTKAFSNISKNIFGLDPIKEDLEVAKKNNPGGKFIFGDATKLPFESNYFDAISSFSVLEHISNLDLALDEINRVLKKDGTLILQQPNRYFLVELHTYLPLTWILPFKIRKFLLKRLNYSNDAIFATDLSLKKLTQKLECHGFSLEIKKMIYPEEIIPSKFRCTYQVLNKFKIFNMIPWGYFIVGVKK